MSSLTSGLYLISQLTYDVFNRMITLNQSWNWVVENFRKNTGKFVVFSTFPLAWSYEVLATYSSEIYSGNMKSINVKSYASVETDAFSSTIGITSSITGGSVSAWGEESAGGSLTRTELSKVWSFSDGRGRLCINVIDGLSDAAETSSSSSWLNTLDLGVPETVFKHS